MMDEIVKAALLGTDRYVPEFRLEFTDIMQQAATRSSDKEACFLTQAGIFFLLQDAATTICRVVPELYPVPVGEQLICEEQSRVLQRGIAEDNAALLEYAIFRLRNDNKIISAILVPDFLEKYAGESPLRNQVVECCGQTGQNILRMQGKIQEHPVGATKDIAAASNAEIRQWIIDIRSREADKIWDIEEGKTGSVFEDILKNEKADKRAEWLELLQTGLSGADSRYLETQLKSKSKAIRAVAIRLLMQVEGSVVQQDFCALIRELVRYECRSQYMGLKKTQEFVLADTHVLSDKYLVYGLDEMSNEKNISDAKHQMYQCIALMPLSLIASCFQIGDQDVIDKLYTEWNDVYIQRAFAVQARTYRNTLLIKTLIEKEKDWSLIGYLAFEDACGMYAGKLSNKFGGQQPKQITAMFQRIFQEEGYPEISVEFARVILSLLRLNCYCIQGKQYYRLGLNWPESGRRMLEEEVNAVPQANDNGYRQQQLQQTLTALNDKTILKKEC